MGNQQSQNKNSLSSCQNEEGCSDTKQSHLTQDLQSQEHIDDYIGKVYIMKSSVMNHHKNTNQNSQYTEQLNSKELCISEVSEVKYSMIFEKVFIDQQHLNQVLGQVRVFQNLNHPNIVQIQSVQSKIIVDSKQSKLYIGIVNCDYYEQNLFCMLQQRKKQIQEQNEKPLTSFAQNNYQQPINKILGLRNTSSLKNISYNNITSEKNITSHKNISIGKNIMFQTIKQDMSGTLSHNSERSNLVTAFSEKEIWYMLDTLINTLKLFQEKEILHGDLRPQTLYLTDEGYLKLSVIQCFGNENFHTSFYAAASSIIKGKSLQQNIQENNLQLSKEQIEQLKKLKNIQSPNSQTTDLIKEIMNKQEFNPYKSEVFSLGILFLLVIFCNSIECCEPLHSNVQTQNQKNIELSSIIKKTNEQQVFQNNFLYLINRQTNDITINYQLISELLNIIKATFSYSLFKILNQCLEINEKNRPDCIQLYNELKNINLQTESSQIIDECATVIQSIDYQIDLNKQQKNDLENFQKDKRLSYGFQQSNSSIEQTSQFMNYTEQLAEIQNKQQLKQKQNKHIKNISIDIMQTINPTITQMNSQNLFSGTNKENTNSKHEQLAKVDWKPQINNLNQEGKQIKSRYSDITQNAQYMNQGYIKRHSIPSVVLTITDEINDHLSSQQNQQNLNKNKYYSHRQHSLDQSLFQKDKSNSINEKQNQQQNTSINVQKEMPNQNKGIQILGSQKQLRDKYIQFQEKKDQYEQKYSLKEIKQNEQKDDDNIKRSSRLNQNLTNSILLQESIRESLNENKQIKNSQAILIKQSPCVIETQIKTDNQSDRRISNSSDKIALFNQKDFLSTVSGSTYSTRDHTLSLSTNFNNYSKRKQSDSILLTNNPNQNQKYFGIGDFNKPEPIQKSNERTYSIHTNTINNQFSLTNSQSLINGGQNKESFLNAHFDNYTNRNHSYINSVFNEENKTPSSLIQLYDIRSPYISLHSSSNSNQKDLKQVLYQTSLNMNDLVKPRQDLNTKEENSQINKSNPISQINVVIEQNKHTQEKVQFYQSIEKSPQLNTNIYNFNSPLKESQQKTILQISSQPKNNQPLLIHSSIDRSISQVTNNAYDSYKNNSVQMKESTELQGIAIEEDEMKHIYGSPKKVLISSPNKLFSPKVQSPSLLSNKNSNNNQFQTQLITSPFRDQLNYDDLLLDKKNSQTLLIISPQTKSQLNNNISARTATFNQEKSYINSLVQPNASIYYSPSYFQSPKNQISFNENQMCQFENQLCSPKNSIQIKNNQIPFEQNSTKHLENQIIYSNTNSTKNQSQLQSNSIYQQCSKNLSGTQNSMNQSNIYNRQAITEKNMTIQNNQNHNINLLQQECQESKNNINDQIEIQEWNDIEESQICEFISKNGTECKHLGMQSQISSLIPGNVYQNLLQKHTNKSIVKNQNEQQKILPAQTDLQMKQDKQMVSSSSTINPQLPNNTFIHRRIQSLNHFDNIPTRNVTTNSIHMASPVQKDHMIDIKPRQIQQITQPDYQNNSIYSQSIQHLNQRQQSTPIQNSSLYNITNNTNHPLKILAQVQTERDIQNKYIMNQAPHSAKASMSKEQNNQQENQFCAPYSTYDIQTKQMIINEQGQQRQQNNIINNSQPQMKLNFLLSSSNMPQQYNSQIKALQSNKMYKEINHLSNAPHSLILKSYPQKEQMLDKTAFRTHSNYTQQQKAILLNQSQKNNHQSFYNKNILL